LERTQSTKVYVTDFIKYLFIVGTLIASLAFIFNFLWPYFIDYKNMFLQVSTFLGENILFFVSTIIIGLVLYFGSKSIMLKLRSLFSETLYAEDIYQASLNSWKNKEYDVVYSNMRYIRDNAMKYDDHNLYSATANAICSFQETSFQDDSMTKEEIKKVVVKILNTYNYEHLYINTIHLAYSFLHLASMEDEDEDRAIAHLICAYLFNLCDLKEYKIQSDLETKIFESLYSEYQSTLENLVPITVFKTMYEKNSDINVFQYNILPYLRKVGEAN